MQNIKEGAEVVQESMSFMQEFLQKKYAWGIVFFVIIIGGLITAIAFYNNGVKTGEKNSIAVVKSLSEAVENGNASIKRLKYDVNDLQMKLDTCNKKSSSTNVEKWMLEELEKADRINKLFEKRYKSVSETNKNLKSVMP